jgi:hypothetical protein
MVLGVGAPREAFVYVFIDESGDPGLSQGASELFVVAAVAAASVENIAEATRAIEKGMAARLHRAEFRFSKCADRVRRAFFLDIAGKDLLISASVLRKSRLETRLGPTTSVQVDGIVGAIRRLPLLDGYRLIIDGVVDRHLAAQLRSALVAAGLTPPIAIKGARSHADRMIQIADMFAGAIARAHGSDRHEAATWSERLRNFKIDVRLAGSHPRA